MGGGVFFSVKDSSAYNEMRWKEEECRTSQKLKMISQIIVCYVVDFVIETMELKYMNIKRKQYGNVVAYVQRLYCLVSLQRNGL